MHILETERVGNLNYGPVIDSYIPGSRQTNSEIKLRGALY